jgi:hypothetical protein
MTVAKEGYNQGKKDAETLLKKHIPHTMWEVVQLQNQLADVMYTKYDQHGSTWKSNYIKGASETFLVYHKAMYPHPISIIKSKRSEKK